MQTNYMFTAEDQMNPVYCTKCKAHIPRTVSASGAGSCPVCISATAQAAAPVLDPTVQMQAIPVVAVGVPASRSPFRSRRALFLIAPVLIVVLFLALLRWNQIETENRERRNEEARARMLEERDKRLAGEYLLIEDDWREQKKKQRADEYLSSLDYRNLGTTSDFWQACQANIDEDERKMETISATVGAAKLRLMINGKP